MSINITNSIKIAKMSLKALLLLSIFASFLPASQNILTLSEKQQSLISEVQRNTFVRDANLEYLTTPFDKELYYHRNTMSEEGQKVFDVVMADLLKFDGADIGRTDLRYTITKNGENGLVTWDLEKLGLSISEHEAKNLNQIIGYDDSRMFHVMFGSYYDGTTTLTKDANGKVTKVGISIRPRYLREDWTDRYAQDILNVEKGMSEILGVIKDDMTDAQQLRAASDKLKSMFTYGKYIQEDTNQGMGKDLDTLLAINNTVAICGGYAHSMQYVMQRLGLQSLYVEGTRDGGAHAWNWVYVDNQWYEIDVLWGRSLNGVDNLHNYSVINTLRLGDYIYQYPIMASHKYNNGISSTAAEIDQYRGIDGGTSNQIITTDIYGIGQSSFNEEAMAQYDKMIANGKIKAISKPTDIVAIMDSILSIGARTEIKANVYGSVVEDMNIDGSIISLGDGVKIDKNLRGAEAKTTGNIENIVMLIGNDTEINRAFNINDTNANYDTRGALSNSGNITNVYIKTESNSTINGNVIIAQAKSSGASISNVIGDFGENNTIKRDFIGAQNDNNASINSTILAFKNNTTIGGNLIGAKIDNVGNINNTTIMLSGKTDVKGDIIGASVGTGKVTGSKIYIYDVINADRIIGGEIKNADANSKATNNLIYIDTDADMPNTKLFGGFSDNGIGDVLTGNRLYFSGQKGVFRDIANFETIEIHIGKINNQSSPTQNQTIANGIIAAASTSTNEPIITLTDTTSTTDLSKTTISLSLDANSNISNVNILKKDGGSITAPKNSIVKALKGVSYIEEFELKMDGNNTLTAINRFLGATTQEKTQNISTSTMSESTILSSGNDMLDLVLLDKNIKNNISTSYIVPNNATQNPNNNQNSKTNTANVIANASTQDNALRAFGMIRGAAISHTNDARINTRVVNIIAGLEKKMNDRVYLGVFFEGGYGMYDSRSDTLQGRATGEGDNAYYGGGALMSYQLNKNDYLEASLRLGQMRTSYSSNDLGTDFNSRSAKFNTSKTYYSAHVGIGKLMRIFQKVNIDLYAKAYYGHIGANKITLDSGESLNFLAFNTLVGKVGARYIHNASNNYILYAGGSYEHEMLGNIKTLNNTINKYYNLPGTQRDTFAIEAGTQIQPTNKDNIMINLHAKYLMGARSGIAGSFKGTYRF